MVQVNGQASCEVFRGPGFHWEVACDPSVEVRLHSVERYFEHGVEARRKVSTVTNGFQMEVQYDSAGRRTKNILRANSAVQRMGAAVHQTWGVANEESLKQIQPTFPGINDAMAGAIATIQVRQDGEFSIGSDKATSVMETIWQKTRK